MIKNALPDKSRNPENLQKLLQQFEIYSTNAPIVRSTGFFIYNFVIQVISEKTLCRKGFTSNLRDIFT